MHDLRVELSVHLFSRFQIIYEGDITPNYMPEMSGYGVCRNAINIQFKFKKKANVSKYWSVGLYMGHIIYKHQKGVIYDKETENIFNANKGLYYEIIKGLYFIF